MFVDGTQIGATTANGAGNFSFTPEEPLTPGPHVITATQTGGAGNVSPPSEEVDVTDLRHWSAGRHDPDPRQGHGGR